MVRKKLPEIYYLYCGLIVLLTVIAVVAQLILRKTYKPKEGEEQLVMQTELPESQRNLDKLLNDQVQHEQANSLFNKNGGKGENVDQVNVDNNDEVNVDNKDGVNFDNKDPENGGEKGVEEQHADAGNVDGKEAIVE